MTLQDLKVYLAIYWYNKTILEYLIGVLVALIALMLIADYYTYHTNWLYVVLFFLIGFIACLVLTIQQYQNVQNQKSGFPPQTQTQTTVTPKS